MFFISHRGNLDKKNINLENSPDYIDRAVSQGFDVEIDVWVLDSKIYLGHDKPEYEVSLSYLKNEKFWCHAKNIEAINLMLSNSIHCFWHEKDKITLTSKNFIWAYPSDKLLKNSIAVMTNMHNEKMDISMCKGVCSDNIRSWKYQQSKKQYKK